jgi:uncharacterized ferritin-like protein (DUF455 family)
LGPEPEGASAPSGQGPRHASFPGSEGPGASDREAWIRAYIESRDLRQKLELPPGSLVARQPTPSPLRLAGPGRDPVLRVSPRADRIPRPGALREASAVARLLHVFTHHEVQAAELCGWAILAFPETAAAFRSELFAVMLDEVRHAASYAARLEELGAPYGTHAVRDWFWERTLGCQRPMQYVALMGLGFEGGNLEHAHRFEALLRGAGDERSAALVARVGREEVAHVHFAARWFSAWSGSAPGVGPDFDRWVAELPPPLTPAVLRGHPLDRDRRGRAGLSEAFLDRLEATGDTRSSSPR